MGKPLSPLIACCVGCGNKIEASDVSWREIDRGERVPLCWQCGAIFHETFTAPAAIVDAQRIIRQTRWWLDLIGARQ